MSTLFKWAFGTQVDETHLPKRVADWPWRLLLVVSLLSALCTLVPVSFALDDSQRTADHGLNNPLSSGFTLSGRVTDVSGAGMVGVTIALGGSDSATTDANGYYTIADVPEGSHTLHAAKAAWSFSPPKRAVEGPPDATGQDFVSTPLPPAPWQMMEIPILLPGSRLGHIWTSGPSDTYVWGQRVTPGTSDVPEVTLYHWNGSTWSVSLTLAGHGDPDVFGTGPTDVYVSANKCATGSAAGCGTDAGGRMWRSIDGGAHWTPLDMPATLGMNGIMKITGTPGNIHVRAAGNLILRLTDSGWSTYSPFDSWGWGAISVFAPNEGYYARCWGWGGWNGTTWQNHADQFDFCDVMAMWGMRAQDGSLQLYVAGDNNWGNGVRVWKFDETTQSFGSKNGYVFADGNGYKYGGAADVWGAAPDDVYVTGYLGDWDQYNPTVGHGRLYHFDGATWARISEIGDISTPSGMSGSSANNLWLALVDGRILRRSPFVVPTLRVTTGDSLICTGKTTTVNLDLANVVNLYGYQFQVSYNKDMASATGAFVNSFFDTANPASKPWNATCADGVCKFAVSHTSGTTTQAVSGSGMLAQIVLTAKPGTTPTAFSMAISDDVLSDIDGATLPHNLGAELPINVCGLATISGNITMQGRFSGNVDTGTVSMVEQAPTSFAAVAPVNFSDTNGAYSIVVPYKAGGSGSSYKIVAGNELYLDNAEVFNVTGNATKSTRLWGGDAVIDHKVNIQDLSCIGDRFGILPVPLCGPIGSPTGSPDINADGKVNIQDLSITGGNFDKCGAQPWDWMGGTPVTSCP